MKRVNFVNIIPNEILTIIADKLYQLSNKDINNYFLISKYTSNIAYDLDLMIKCLGHKNALLNINRMKKGNVNMINYILSKTTDSFKDMNEFIILSAISNNLDILNYWINYGIKATDYNYRYIINSYIDRANELNTIRAKILYDSNLNDKQKNELLIRSKEIINIDLNIINVVLMNYPNLNESYYYLFHFNNMYDNIDNLDIKNDDDKLKAKEYILDSNRYILYNLIKLFINNNFNKIYIYEYFIANPRYINRERDELINENYRNKMLNYCFSSGWDISNISFNNINIDDLPLLIEKGLNLNEIFKFSCKYYLINYIYYCLDNNIDLSGINISLSHISPYENLSFLPSNILFRLLNNGLEENKLFETIKFSGNLDIIRYFFEYKKNIPLKAVHNLILNMIKLDTLALPINNFNFESIKYLFNRCEDINFNNNQILRTILDKSYCIHNITHIIRLVIELGGNIFFDNHYPLKAASRFFKKNVVKYLIDEGSDIHINNDEPIKCALRHNNIEVAKLLIDYGAILDYEAYKILFKKFIQKKTLQEAANKQLTELVDYIFEKTYIPTDLSTKLIYDGIDLNAFNSRALKIAIENNFTSIVKLLLLGGAKYNDYTLLKTAIDNNNMDIVMLLVSYGIPDEDYINGIQYSKDLDRKEIDNYLIYAKKLNDLYK